MAVTETVRRNDDNQYPGLLNQRRIELDDGAIRYELIPGVARKQIQIILLGIAVTSSGTYVLMSGTIDNLMHIPVSNSGGFFRQSPNMDMPLFCGNIGESIYLQAADNCDGGGVYIQWREKD